MNEESKLCPLCGSKPHVKVEYEYDQLVESAWCPNQDCPLFEIPIHPDDWNARPIEDELRAKLARCERALEIAARVYLADYILLDCNAEDVDAEHASMQAGAWLEQAGQV